MSAANRVIRLQIGHASQPGNWAQQLFASVRLNLLEELKDLVRLANINRWDVDYHQRDEYHTRADQCHGPHENLQLSE